MTSTDSDQHVHPPSIAGLLYYPSLDSGEAVEGIYDQGRLRRTAQDAQVDLILR